MIHSLIHCSNVKTDRKIHRIKHPTGNERLMAVTDTDSFTLVTRSKRLNHLEMTHIYSTLVLGNVLRTFSHNVSIFFYDAALKCVKKCLKEHVMF